MTNVTAQMKLKRGINLTHLASSSISSQNEYSIEWDQENSPGFLTLTFDDGMKVRVFHTGQLMVNRAKNVQKAEECLLKGKKIAEKFYSKVSHGVKRRGRIPGRRS